MWNDRENASAALPLFVAKVEGGVGRHSRLERQLGLTVSHDSSETSLGSVDPGLSQSYCLYWNAAFQDLPLAN